MRQLLHRHLQVPAPAWRCIRSPIHKIATKQECCGITSHLVRRCLDSTRPAASAAQAYAGDSVPQLARTDDNASSIFWPVVISTALVLLVCNVDRICMSVAVIPMSKSFGWSPAVQGFIGAAFLWGYMSTQLLGGEAAAKYGGKLVISAAIVFFSLASLLPLAAPLVPAAQVLTLVIISRILGEILEPVDWACSYL
jgi:Major Facilitator Superfamily